MVHVLLLFCMKNMLNLIGGIAGSIGAVEVCRCQGWGKLQTCCIVRFHQHSRNRHVGVLRTAERSLTYSKTAPKFKVYSASGQPLESEPGAYDPKNIRSSVKNGLDAFYRFSRPHTVIGTVKYEFSQLSSTKFNC